MILVLNCWLFGTGKDGICSIKIEDTDTVNFCKDEIIKKFGLQTISWNLCLYKVAYLFDDSLMAKLQDFQCNGVLLEEAAEPLY